MEASTTAGTIVSSSSVFTSSSRNISTILFTQPSVTGVLTTTPTHMTETTTDTSVGVLTTFAHVTETISDASVEVLTTFAHMTETISDAFVGVLTTTPTHMTETISDASVGVLTTSADMTETTADAFLGFLTTTSADMTETTSDAFLGPRVCNSTMQGAPPSKRNHQDQGALQTVGAANVDDESVRAIVVGVPLALFLAILLALALALVLLCCTSKRKGTYYTNEAECGDSVDSYGGAFQSEKVLLEILNEEE
ncbi:uncharacterized protein LOC129840393 isoform X1 [Salvelinus fontinalis]|uniref:uncharacterized protein LOC129840393 isoform X1 n=1 Tax=Salvelinus fontinalis TaxID=8038 RepID=UPI0024855B5C|nr:uncharacterized protein LOC129840393 isoform X1 [Salvelinus fontinalis]